MSFKSIDRVDTHVTRMREICMPYGILNYNPRGKRNIGRLMQAMDFTDRPDCVYELARCLSPMTQIVLRSYIPLSTLPPLCLWKKIQGPSLVSLWRVRNKGTRTADTYSPHRLVTRCR